MDATERQHDLEISRMEYDDGWTVAADLRPLADDEVTVELIDDTAVVAVDTPMLRTEIDIDLPDDGGTASLRNGVLVVEGSA
ncbi:Hsp20/alpha crystallin family protein [Haloarcula onubensis]|uniref:Hsp20/alpha crystallin family protein n=1 Tax=Haloarcula onubensis TaxID=2950539 RepID=A0ABU2FRK9_9EURY|nr:Hsp20/alpha crystallin family protein [Halomicroarcula sp. S3CR25-11]MDS0283054.1 Hsp20/alpha crystallin family protein [Halomicroarcula sp. S3CR25-11]